MRCVTTTPIGGGACELCGARAGYIHKVWSRSTVDPPTLLQRNRRFQNQLPAVSREINTVSLDTPTSSIVRPLHTLKIYVDESFFSIVSSSLCRAASHTPFVLKKNR